MLSRRRLLGLGSTAAIGLAAGGCSTAGVEERGEDAVPAGRSFCTPRAGMDPHDAIAGLPLVYEISRRRSDFWFEPGFHDQLTEWVQVLPQSVDETPDQLWTYGSWIGGSGGCTSWHNAGRAFDLARVRIGGGEFVSCRHDQWRNESGTALDGRLRAYWRLAASLHLRFAYVLTYLYDARHENHIHVDNGRSGQQRSTFSPSSRVQVQAVQAIATHLWRRPLPITGRFDRATRTVTGTILDGLGLPDTLSRTEAWQGFLAEASRRDAG